MKTLLNISFFCFFSILSASAQEPSICGSSEWHQKLLKTDTSYRNKMVRFEKKWQAFNENKSTQRTAFDSMVRIIPVVFHIIHNNGPENIPDSLIYQQLEILNEDFRKKPGTHGDGAGVDTRIEFCLASIDPDGNPTTGIIRTVSSCTDMSQPGCPLRPLEIISWDPNKYFNIYIQKYFGYLGFAFYGLCAQVKYSCVGRNSTYYGRVLTHEAGHWLTLDHTFEDGCDSSGCYRSGDKVCDTPPVAYPSGDCSNKNSCQNDVPDLSDNTRNYMDYSGTCTNMFTEGQKLRMRLFLATNPNYLNESTLLATGCHPCVNPPCKPIANLWANKRGISTGQTVTFSDYSYNFPTAWNWSFPGGTPDASTLQNPEITYNTPGKYNVTLIASNGGGSDTIFKNNYIQVTTSQWSNVGQKMSGDSLFNYSEVLSLEVYHNRLYAGGIFKGVRGVPVNHISAWDGVKWNSLENGVQHTLYNNYTMVSSMIVYNNELLVGGYFNKAGNISVENIVKWNDTTWVNMDTGIVSLYGFIEFRKELYLIDDGNKIKKLTETGFKTIITFPDYSYVYCMEVYKDELYVGGIFDSINDLAVSGLAKFNGVNWLPVGNGGPSINDNGLSINCMKVYNNELVVAGSFQYVGVKIANSIAKWDGSVWTEVGTGVAIIITPIISPGTIYSMEVFNNELYVGGSFRYAGEGNAKNIARWDGNSWFSLGNGIESGGMLALKVFNNELYAGIDAPVDTAYVVFKWGCPDLQVSFSQNTDTLDLAVSGDVLFNAKSANGKSWFWDFGDGYYDTLPDPLHTYTSPGIYNIKLTVTGDSCSNSAVSTVTVLRNCPALSVKFIQSADTVNLYNSSGEVSFTSYDSTDQTTDADSILWNFGDGTKGKNHNPVHTYTSPGNFTVTLTGYRDTCSVTAKSKVVVILKVGADNPSSQISDFKIFPNPVTNENNVSLIINKTEYIKLELWDMYGKLLSVPFEGSQKGNERKTIRLNTSVLKPGIYLLRLNTSGSQLFRKMMVME